MPAAVKIGGGLIAAMPLAHSARNQTWSASTTDLGIAAATNRVMDTMPWHQKRGKTGNIMQAQADVQARIARGCN